MNSKKLYENIMSSIAKEIKKTLNEDDYEHWDDDYSDDTDYEEEPEEKVMKEFSHEDLEELKQYMLEDDDFYEVFCNKGNMNYYDSYEDSINDFINFLENDIEDFSDTDPDFEGVHAWYILDNEDYGTSYMVLKSGTIANLDNLYQEYSQCVSAL